jgi:hypothetical protein
MHSFCQTRKAFRQQEREEEVKKHYRFASSDA